MQSGNLFGNWGHMSISVVLPGLFAFFKPLLLQNRVATARNNVEKCRVSQKIR